MINSSRPKGRFFIGVNMLTYLIYNTDKIQGILFMPNAEYLCYLTQQNITQCVAK
jgi:hypothetical protein